MGKRKPKSSEVAAIEDLKKRIRIARSKADFVQLAELYNLLGNQHRLLGNYEDALDAHQEEINFSKKNSKDKMGLGIAYRNLGEVLTEMKKETEAIQYILMYRNIAAKENNFVEQQRAYITLGRAYLTMADKEGSEEDVENSENRLDSKYAAERAENSFRQAYKYLCEDELREQVADEKEFMLMKCNNCQNLGIVLELLGKFEDATKWFYKAIDIGKKYQFNENLAPCYTMLCGLMLKEKKWKDALNAAKSATKAAKALGAQELEIESQLWEAKALFLNDEVDAGKKILKKLRNRIKKKEEFNSYSDQLDPLLIASVRISRTHDELYLCDKTDAEKCMKLHEILGDNYIPLGNFETAILHYKKSCQFSEQAGIEGKTLAKLYFSIAETYRDLEDYANACKYYRKEMGMHSGNPVEEFKTQTCITVVLEKLRKSPEEVIEAHELAIALARMSKSLTKELTALNNFGLYLKSIGRREDAVKQFGKANDIKAENNITDLEELDSQDLLGEEDNDDVDLDALSEEDSDDDEVDDVKKGAKTRYNVRKNEVGESQLHVAAKKGDLKSVRKLIRQGHPVHVRDNAGWTPLHEACNYGHATVVEELLKGGAKVNDGGGALADKVTPLHDASCNCHSDVMKVLLKYGADVLARDKEGKYPIESLLSWRHSEGGKDCTEDDLVAYREVKELLRDLMAKAGKTYRIEDEQRARKKAHGGVGRSTSPKVTYMVSNTRDYECPIPMKVFTDDYDPDEEGEGKKLYQNTIKQVGRKKGQCGSSKGDVRAISPGPTGPLVPSERNVQNQSDWLLGDDEVDPIEPNTSHQTTKSKTKRKRDPMDDVLLKDRSMRRKTSEGDGGGGRRQKNQEIAASTLEKDEIMDTDSSSVHASSSRTHYNAAAAELNVSESEIPDNDEHFSCSFEDDFGLNIQQHDDFLPSQRPAGSTTEFGRTINIPINEQSDDEDDEISFITKGRRASKRSPTKNSRPTINVSSSSDESDNNCQAGSRHSSILKYFRKSGDSLNSNEGANRTEGRVDTMRRQTSSISLASHNLNFNNRRIEAEEKREVLRFKVHILGNSLLVPVEEKNRNETVDWLSQECATRYLRSYGVKPLLSLQTKDGATLTGTDSISFVLDANERELVGNVTGFDLPSLSERYTTASVKANLQMDPEIMTCLNICESSNILNLNDVCIRGASSSVLMNALQRQNSLKVLILSGCSLFDNGISELCTTLPTLSGLTELDISSNGITKVGFTAFADVFLKENHQPDSFPMFYSVPVGLTSLVLSHNPLGSHIGNILANLLTKLGSLNRLEISDCDLSDKFFSLSKNQLTTALKNSRLEELDISYNHFKDVGLEKCLRNLPARKMRSLNCSASCSSSITNDTVARAISTLLSGNEDCCNLKTLQLNDCGLNDKSLEMIIDTFDRLVRLDNLELACNDSLTSLSLVNILKRSVEHEIPLSQLDLGSIPNLWNNSRVTDEMVLQAIIHKLGSEKKLSLLRVPTSEMDSENVSGGSPNKLSKLEMQTVGLMEDHAGNGNFHIEKRGACITYHFDD